MNSLSLIEGSTSLGMLETDDLSIVLGKLICSTVPSRASVLSEDHKQPSRLVFHHATARHVIG